MSNSIDTDLAELNLDPKQQEAVKACVTPARRVVAITGPAGTGKTTIIRHVVRMLNEAGYTTALGAPTGKAAKRIKEATGYPAQTFHRLLEFSNPGERDERGNYRWDSYPKRNRDNPVDADVIIGDEYAMVNTVNHGDITGAIRRGGRLLVFGDANQLPPIEEKNVKTTKPKFKELLDRFDGITLDTIHRTGNGSGIASNGKRILGGFAPVPTDDFTRTITTQPLDALLRVVQLGEVDYKSIDNQIITPTKITWVGSHKLNSAIQSALMPYSSGWLDLGRHQWEAKLPVRVRVGDKVVINQNLYALPTSDGTDGVFNGETGIITAISDLAEIEINLGDRVVVIPPQMTITLGNKTVTKYPHRDIGLAYALTTHKCQGSEYQNVVYLMNRSQFRMLNRFNLYTGLSRARKHATLITDMDSLSRSISNTETQL